MNPRMKLLDRLQRGQKWLTAIHEELLGEEGAGLGSDKEIRFLEALDLWDSLEYQVRFVFGLVSCVHRDGTICPDTAPISCRHCAGVLTVGVT